MYQGIKSKFNYDVNDGKDGKKIDFGKFFELRSILIYVLSILIGMCKLSSGATPFGLALIGAIADFGFPLILPVILISITTAFKFGGTCLLKFLISTIVFIVLKSFVKGNTKTGNAAKVLFATALSEIVVLVASETLIYDAIMAAFMSSTTAVFYLVFSEGLPIILDFKNRKIDTQETLIASGILLAVAISGVGDFSVCGLSIRSIICVLIVLIMGWKQGAACGIVSGVSISLVLGIIGVENASTVATYAVCGLLSGVLSGFGKIGAIIGFILGNAIWVYYINASTDIIIPIAEIVIASLVLFFLPKRVSNFIDNLFDNNAIEGIETAGLLTESTIFKLKAVSEVAEDMAQNVETNENDSADQIGEFIRTLNDNTCKKCKNYEKCWKENYHSMYETLFNSIEVLKEKTYLSINDIENSICNNKIALVEGINFSYEIYKLNKEWESKVNENKRLVANQLRGVSKAIENVQEEIISDLNVNNNLLTAGFKLEIGVSKAKKKGSLVSGDSNNFLQLKNGKILVALSDGMGTGENAARSSKKVLELLEKYLNAGLDKKVAIELINSYIMLGENKENYSTLDAVLFNPNDATAEFIKFGACPTYIKKADKIESISSKLLPIGTTTNIDPSSIIKILNRGDFFVIASDGIFEANSNKRQWIKEFLEVATIDRPQRISDIILQEAIDCNYGITNDDMTIIVGKVC